MPLIPALGRQRQADFRVRGQPDLQSEFQDSQGYTEKPYLEKPKKKKEKEEEEEEEKEEEEEEEEEGEEEEEEVDDLTFLLTGRSTGKMGFLLYI